MRKRDKSYRKMKLSNNPDDRKHFKSIRHLVQREIRNAYWNYVQDIITPTENNNPKRFYSFIKSLKKESTGVAPLKDQGQLVTDPKGKAEDLNKQFCSVFTQDDDTDLPDMGASPHPIMPNITICTNGVLKLLCGLNPNKACGPDQISPRVMKYLANELAPMLQIIFTKSLDTGEIPSDWRLANISPIYKKGLELAERLKSGEVPGVAKVLETIQKLAEDHDVKVYYVRGNHDHQMTEEGCKKMFGNKVEFVKGVLLYEIQEGDEVYRCRFEHGHEWDIFNSYCLGEDPDQLLPGEQNLGYFVSRFIATSKFTGSSISKFLFNHLSKILTRVGFDFLGTPVVKMFSTDRMQRFLTSTLLEKGYQNKIHPEQKVVVNKDGDYVTFEQLCKYKLVERTAAKYGSNRTFDMMKHSIHDLSDFLTTCDEDVVVMGHSEEQACTKMPGRHGDLIYANGGAWHDEAGVSGYIKITPPRHDIRKDNGIVELKWLSHNRDTFHFK